MAIGNVGTFKFQNVNNFQACEKHSKLDIVSSALKASFRLNIV